MVRIHDRPLVGTSRFPPSRRRSCNLPLGPLPLVRFADRRAAPVRIHDRPLVANLPVPPFAISQASAATIAPTMTEMVIYGVSFDLVGKQPIVLLKTTDGNRYLPIWIGQSEAAAILMKLQGTGDAAPAHARSLHERARRSSMRRSSASA